MDEPEHSHDQIPVSTDSCDLSSGQHNQSPKNRLNAPSRLTKTANFFVKVVRRTNIGGLIEAALSSMRIDRLPFLQRRTSSARKTTLTAASEMTEEQFHEHLDEILNNYQTSEKLPPEYVIYQHHRYDFVYDDKPWSEDNAYQRLLGSAVKRSK